MFIGITRKMVGEELGPYAYIALWLRGKDELILQPWLELEPFSSLLMTPQQSFSLTQPPPQHAPSGGRNQILAGSQSRKLHFQVQTRHLHPLCLQLKGQRPWPACGRYS